MSGPRDDPNGRMGMLLAPGAYFPLCLMVAFIVAATLATPETIQNNGAFIGPDLAVSVQSAASRGEIWRIIGTIMPIYGTAIIIGLLGVCLKRWAHEDWNLRVSLRAAFYVLATLISWLLLVSAAMDLMRISTGNNNLPAYIYILLIIPTCSWIIWIYYWFFQDNESLSKIRSFALGIGMFVLLAAPIVISDILMRLQS